ELKKRKPDIKIIFVSGYAEDAFDKNLPDRKQFNFLAKPFTLKQLVRVVKETMAGEALRHGRCAPPPRLRGGGWGAGGTSARGASPSPGAFGADLCPHAGRGGACGPDPKSQYACFALALERLRSSCDRAGTTSAGQIRGDRARSPDRQRALAVFPHRRGGRRDLARQCHVRAAPARRLPGARRAQLRAGDRGAGAIGGRRARCGRNLRPPCTFSSSTG